MRGVADQSVGDQFQLDLLQAARDKTLQIIHDAAKKISPGMTENEARALIAQIQAKAGAPKSWHPPQIRFGENTVQTFGKRGIDNPTLKENDIFFIDIGPIFDDHEGDVGRAFSVGQDSEMKKCCQDIGQIWTQVRDHWKIKDVSGQELYKFAQATAKNLGWVFILEEANGHRIADFPHAAKARGSIGNWETSLAPDRWILEIQIRHPSRPFGAFFEDLLA